MEYMTDVNMANDLQILTRQRKAVELRKQGKSYWMIALECDVSEAQAYRDVQAQLAILQGEATESVAELVAIELGRLDTLFYNSYAMAEVGSLKASLVCLKIMERRAKLLGLDKPMKVDQRVLSREISDEDLETEARKLGIVLDGGSNGDNS